MKEELKEILKRVNNIDIYSNIEVPHDMSGRPVRTLRDSEITIRFRGQDCAQKFLDLFLKEYNEYL